MARTGPEAKGPEVNNLRSSNVTVEDASAIAAMGSFGQRFCLDGSASRAGLGSSARINRDNLSTSICSFVGEHGGQLSPRGIANVFGQHPAGEALDIQVFNRDATEAVDDFTTFFVQKVAAASGDMRIEFEDGSLALPAHFRAIFTARKSALQPTKFARIPLGRVEPPNCFTVAQRHKRRKTKVNGDGVRAGAINGCDLNLTNDIPFASLSTKDRCRGLIRHVAVPANLDLARNADKPYLTVLANCHTVTDSKIGGVIPSADAKAGEPSLIAALNSAIKRNECFIKSAQHLSLTARGPAALVRKVSSDWRQAFDLVKTAYRNALGISGDSVLKRTIVKLAKVGKHFRQERGLRLVRLNAVTVTQYAHDLFALSVLRYATFR